VDDRQYDPVAASDDANDTDSHLIARNALPIDNGLMASQRDTDLRPEFLLGNLSHMEPLVSLTLIDRSGDNEPS
jgi:hypothetical protein